MEAPVVKAKTRRSIDDEALERALAAALARQKASDVPRRDGLTQVESMLRDRPRREVCEFASYSEQMHALQLRPWMFPPCWLDLNDRHPEHLDGVALLRRLLDNNLSKYEPNPVAALQKVEAPPAT
jgi:hypothetical protein